MIHIVWLVGYTLNELGNLLQMYCTFNFKNKQLYEIDFPIDFSQNWYKISIQLQIYNFCYIFLDFLMWVFPMYNANLFPENVNKEKLCLQYSKCKCITYQFLWSLQLISEAIFHGFPYSKQPTILFAPASLKWVKSEKYTQAFYYTYRFN